MRQTRTDPSAKWTFVKVENVTETVTSTEVYYVHTNHLDAPLALTDDNGTIAWQASLTPFGEINISTDNLPESFTARFPGQYSDSETGFYYNYFRDYDPELGRYIQSDPIGLGGGINTYGDVGGDPVGSVDSTGLVIDTIADIGFIVYDLYRIGADNIFNDCDNLGSNLTALGADVVGLFTPGATGLGAASRVTKKAIHKNSLDYVGETHVYRIKGPDGTYKIGESAQGTRARDGTSIRAEQQVRKIQRETGEIYESRILKTFPNKRAAIEYQDKLRDRFRRRYGQDTLLGNREHLRGKRK